MKVLPLPSQARLKEVLDYNEETGEFRWKVRAGRWIKIGDVAGKKNDAYIRIRVDKITYSAHRLAWMYMTGEDPGELDIDHNDKNKHNNAFSNLRKATTNQNGGNRKLNKITGTGYKGVTKEGSKYKAQITYNKKYIYLGRHNTPEEAHKAYCEAADKYFGEFANYG